MAPLELKNTNTRKEHRDGLPSRTSGKRKGHRDGLPPRATKFVRLGVTQASTEIGSTEATSGTGTRKVQVFTNTTPAGFLAICSNPKGFTVTDVYAPPTMGVLPLASSPVAAAVPQYGVLRTQKLA